MPPSGLERPAAEIEGGVPAPPQGAEVEEAAIKATGSTAASGAAINIAAIVLTPPDCVKVAKPLYPRQAVPVTDNTPLPLKL